jgi:hypothetical protein
MARSGSSSTLRSSGGGGSNGARLAAVASADHQYQPRQQTLMPLWETCQSGERAEAVIALHMCRCQHPTSSCVCRAVIHDVLQGLDRSNCLVLQVGAALSSPL